MSKPFVKWAGGKSQLIKEISKRYPQNLGITINKYCEPFVGGGAVLFDILGKYSFKELLINDINSDLIDTYNHIKSNVFDLIGLLKILEHNYFITDDRKAYYYDIRDRFNFLKSDNISSLEKSSLFIFLNKTCFNGLYRVNKKGLFNVPMGDYKNPLICDKKNLVDINNLLQNVEIKCGDYSDCISFIDNETFVYIDPPYRPLSITSSFTSYNESIFDDNEQIRLSKFVNKVVSSGANIIISNSDPKNINKDDLFFDLLYEQYNIERIEAKRMINSKASSRGNINELLISYTGQ